MRVPVEITYRNVNKSDAIEKLIYEKVDKLNDFHDNIVSCRISIDQHKESKSSGNSYHLRIGVRVPPGKELVVRQKSTEEGSIRQHLPYDVGFTIPQFKSFRKHKSLGCRGMV